MSLRQLFLISLFPVCTLVSFNRGFAQDEISDKHIQVSLRMIGHQVLLQSGDSTSLVLPIVKNENQYRIEFDSEFSFIPDDLVIIVDDVVQKTNIAKGYILEVEQCETGDIVYSYEKREIEELDILPCKARLQPKSCYNLLFTLVEDKEAKPSVVVPLDQSRGAGVKANKLNYIFVGLACMLLIVLFYIIWKTKSKRKINPNLIQLGNYFFDKRNTELILKERRIELTSKEAELLLVLYGAVNETVERDVILNVVWGDEGDYVGRTLDVFVSKLRKKLEADSSVKIVNIRGVGYKLVADI